MSDPLWPHGLYPARFLCPWDFSRHRYWSGLPFPPPGIFLIQGSNFCFLHLLLWQADSLPLAPHGKPLVEDYQASKITNFYQKLK